MIIILFVEAGSLDVALAALDSLSMCWDFRPVPPHSAKSPLQLPEAVTAAIFPSFSFAAPASSPGSWLPCDSWLITSGEPSLPVSFSLCALCVFKDAICGTWCVWELVLQNHPCLFLAKDLSRLL